MVSNVLSGTSRPFPNYVQQLIEDTQTSPALVRSVGRTIVGVLLRQRVPRAAAVLAVDDRFQQATRVNSLPTELTWRVGGF